VPVTSRSASFSQEQIQHKFSYKDQEIVEALGAKNFTFSYAIPFREDIIKGPYSQLFTSGYPQFVLACRDRSPGDLVDPVLGTFRARCVSFSDDTDPNKRDGTDVRVEFVHAPLLDDIDILQGGILDVHSARDDAQSLDDEALTVNWEQEEPPEATVDPLAAIDGFGRQIENAGNRVSAQLDKAAFKLEKLETTVDRLQNPKVWPLKRSARRLRGAVVQLQETVARTERKVKEKVLLFAQGPSAIANDVQNNLQDLLGLNPELARSPTTRKGQRIKYYAK